VVQIANFLFCKSQHISGKMNPALSIHWSRC